MKKIILSTLLVAGALTAGAQEYALGNTGGCNNWYIGVEGGMTTPLNNHNHGFFGDARGIFGVNLKKQLTPVFGVGVEGSWQVNTSSWKMNQPKSKNAIDSQYVGLYGTVNLMNLFGGYKYNGIFDIEVQAGAGWGHDYYPSAEPNGRLSGTDWDTPIVNGHPTPGDHGDWNYFATQAGLNFNFHVSDRVTLSLKPSVRFDMSDVKVHSTSAAYSADNAQFNLQAGVSVRLGKKFEYVRAFDESEIAALNGQINDLRAANLACEAAAADLLAQNAALASQLDACLNQPKPTAVKEVVAPTMRYINFTLGDATIPATQMLNVNLVADYLKSNPSSKVVVKGYASQDGSLEFNNELSQKRADAVKEALVGFGIDADRITAVGEGVSTQFPVESWNRVAICTVD